MAEPIEDKSIEQFTNELFQTIKDVIRSFIRNVLGNKRNIIMTIKEFLEDMVRNYINCKDEYQYLCIRMCNKIVTGKQLTEKDATELKLQKAEFVIFEHIANQAKLITNNEPES